MDDSDRLDDRVGELAFRVMAEGFAARGINASTLRDLPPLTDAERLADERRAFAEWVHAKADIMLRALPPLYRDADFPDTPEGQAAFAWCDEYRRGIRRPLAIMGPVGTGKTWIAAAVARELLLRGAPAPQSPDGPGRHPVPVRFMSMDGMLQSMRPGNEQVDLVAYATPPVLVLDDFGTERLTEWEADRLWSLAYARTNAQLPIVLTTNLTPEQIKARYEQRTVQRLFSGAAVVATRGQSIRPMPPGF
jgi:hypothetical protein